MTDPDLMQMLKRTNKLSNIPPALGLFQPSFKLKSILQVPLLTQLHHQVHVSPINIRFIKSDYVSMAHLKHDRQLVFRVG